MPNLELEAKTFVIEVLTGFLRELRGSPARREVGNFSALDERDTSSGGCASRCLRPFVRTHLQAFSECTGTILPEVGCRGRDKAARPDRKEPCRFGSH